jgi:Tfp pilus assembly protein PilO
MNKSNNALLYLIGSIAIAILVGIFFINPAFDNIQKIRVKHAEAENNYKTEKALSENIKKISNQSANLQNEIARLSIALPTTYDTQSLIVQIDNIARNSNVKLTSVAPQAEAEILETLEPKTSPNAYQELNVALNLTGTYPQFKLFLNELEKNLRIIDIDSVSISPVLATEETAAEEETAEEETTSEEEVTSEVLTSPNQEYSVELIFKAYYQNE